MFTNEKIYGLEPAIRSMRNPMDSWHLADSRCDFYNDYEQNNNEECFVIGDKDLILAQKLIKNGSEHCKFLRMIDVWVDMDMTRYWWSEMDTYHFNVKNSCSTMHKLLNRKVEITRADFLWCGEDTDILEIVIERLNQLRVEFLDSKDAEEKNRLLLRAKRILPEGFLQMRTVKTSYAELRNIYFQRRNHRLHDEWVDDFCWWVSTLPYAKELIMYEG